MPAWPLAKRAEAGRVAVASTLHPFTHTPTQTMNNAKTISMPRGTFRINRDETQHRRQLTRCNCKHCHQQMTSGAVYVTAEREEKDDGGAFFSRYNGFSGFFCTDCAEGKGSTLIRAHA